MRPCIQVDHLEESVASVYKLIFEESNLIVITARTDISKAGSVLVGVPVINKKEI
jgi:hypothetical protein